MNPVLAARMHKKAADMKTSFHAHGEDIIIAQSQDCTPIAEWAKQQASMGEVGSPEMRHAARIPNVIIEKYMNEHRVSFQEVMNNPVHMRRIVNNPDNAAFRIWKGVV